MRAALTALLVTLVLDQGSKLAVIGGMGLAVRGEIEVLPPWLNFRMAWNRGINFGLFSGGDETLRWLIIAISVVIPVWVWLWLRRRAPGLVARISAGLLAGGAFGNVIDRLRYGAVADFLNMSCCGIENPYAFNIADIAIFAGVAGLVLFAGQPPSENPPSENPSGRGAGGPSRQARGGGRRKTP